MFTGDTLFTNGVGRPDLHADPEAARARARSLFMSLEQLRQFRPEIVGVAGTRQRADRIRRTARCRTARRCRAWLAGWLSSESEFVDRVTSNLPPTPPNFVRIVDLNEAGDLPAGDPTDLEAGANRCAVR